MEKYGKFSEKSIKMTKLTDESPMPYGKYKGIAMANVPADYLLFLYENNKCSFPVRQYINKNIDVIKMEAKK